MKRLYQNIRKDPEKLKRFQKLPPLGYVQSFYGDGKFYIYTGGAMPAGIQIEYKGIIRMYDKIPGYEYFIGEKTIVIINMGNEISYKEQIFSYEGKFTANNIMVVDWQLNAVYSHPTNNKIQTFNQLGGQQTFKNDTSILASKTEENPSGEDVVTLWPNLGSHWGEYGNKGDRIGRIPKKSK